MSFNPPLSTVMNVLIPESQKEAEAQRDCEPRQTHPDHTAYHLLLFSHSVVSDSL